MPEKEFYKTEPVAKTEVVEVVKPAEPAPVTTETVTERVVETTTPASSDE